MKRILGLDTGTNSLGWAVVDRFDDGKYNLVRRGTLIFQEGVKIEKGIESSKAAERTEYRSSRRHYFRRRLRKIETLKVLIKYRLCPALTEEELKLWHLKKKYPMNEAFLQWQRTNDNTDVNPYHCRHIFLHEKLNLEKESDRFILGRAFYHLAQRRGFLSNRLDQTKENDDGMVKTSISQLGKDMQEAGCEYLGDYFYKLYQEKSNTIRIRKNYTSRKDHYIKEFNAICDCQNLPDDMRKALYDALYFQRPLKSQRYSVGKCTFEKNKPRCAVSHPLYEEFRKLSFINNIRVRVDFFGKGEERPLNEEEIKKIDKLFYRKSKNFDFEDIAKAIAGKDNYQWLKAEGDKQYKFNYRMDQGVSGCPTQTELKDLFGDDWMNGIAERYTCNKHQDGTPKTQEEMATDIWNVLFSFDDDGKVKEFGRKKLQMSEEEAEKFANIKLQQGYASLSLKAIHKILPFLRQGDIYTYAVFLAKVPDIVGHGIWERDKDEIIADLKYNIDLAIKEHRRIDEAVRGYLENNFELRPGILDDLYHPSINDVYEDAKPNKDGILQLGSPKTNAVRNPMAMRSLHQVRKVVNQLLLEGVIDRNTEVHIEYARDLNDANMRQAISSYQGDQKNEHNKAAKEIRKLYNEETGMDIEPTDDDILKFQLWNEQEHKCIYTGATIGIADFVGADSKFDIEHTIPQSVGGDSTRMNLTLCDAKFNREVKKAQLPSQLSDYDNIMEHIKPWKDKIEDLTRQIKKIRTYSGMDKREKDSKIQKRNRLKIELDYWKGKYERFTMKDVPEGFARRQGAGIGLISKYAGLYLRSLFHDPANPDKRQIYIVKGPMTAEFRKMWGVQEEYEKKSRDNHAHHCIDAIVIACIGKAEYDRLAFYYTQVEKGVKPEFEKPWNTFTQDVKKIADELLVVHDTPDNMPKHTRKRVRISGRGIKMAQGDSARGKLHEETYYGAIKKDDEINYVSRRSLEKLKETDVDNIVDDVVRQKIKDAVSSKGFKEAIKGPIFMNEEKGILIKKVRCYAKMVKNPLIIRQQRDVSAKDYKQQFYVTTDTNYCMAIYEGMLNGKLKRSYEIVDMIEASKYYKESNDTKNVYPIVPENRKELKYKCMVKTGTQVILLQNSEEKLDLDDEKSLSKRLYHVAGMFKDGRLVLRSNKEAREAGKLSKETQAGVYKESDDYRSQIRISLSDFHALIEGYDFKFTPLGDIKLINHA